MKYSLTSTTINKMKTPRKFFFDTEFIEGKQTFRDNYISGTGKILYAAFFTLLFAAYLIFTDRSYWILVTLMFLWYMSYPLFFASNSYFKDVQPTIELISIGIVDENGNKYYAVSKDFNLDEAWNRYQIQKHTRFQTDGERLPDTKEYWIRENVLRPIYNELSSKRSAYEKTYHWELGEPFSLKSMRYLLERFGKDNKTIAKEIIDFTSPVKLGEDGLCLCTQASLCPNGKIASQPRCSISDFGDIQFYGYYADYDWVVFCWLFGKMIDLPKGFPYYCIDIKQILDNRVSNLYPSFFKDIDATTLEARLDYIKKLPQYPKVEKEHHALADAQFNLDLYNFLKEGIYA